MESELYSRIFSLIGSENESASNVQNSPFAGMLSEPERRRILELVR